VSNRKDVLELLRLYEGPHPREAFKPHLQPSNWREREKLRLHLRSQVPDHLESAFDVALGELLEQEILEPNEQVSLYESLGLPVPAPGQLAGGKSYPIFPANIDALVWITDKGRAALAEHSTPSATVTSGHGDEKPEVAATNSLRLKGAVWHVRYGDEVGDFSDRTDSVFHRLARLLDHPYRLIRAFTFFHPGAAEPPHMGRDEASDHEAKQSEERELNRLMDKIRDAAHTQNENEAARLYEDYSRIKEHLDAEKGQNGRKKRLGDKSPAEKADHNLRVLLGKLHERLRKAGMPALADHLEKYIDNSGCEWWYMPPPGTSPWHVESDPPK
jgi:hypothetical protein